MIKVLNGWLSPKGQFFECESGEHCSTARHIIKNTEWKDIGFHDYMYPENSVEDLGFIKISGKPYAFDTENENMNSSSSSSIIIQTNKGIAEEQQNWLRDNYNNFTILQKKCLDEYYRYLELLK